MRARIPNTGQQSVIGTAGGRRSNVAPPSHADALPPVMAQRMHDVPDKAQRQDISPEDPVTPLNERQLILPDPEVQRFLLSFGLFIGPELILQLLEKYLPAILAVQQQQLRISEEREARERNEVRWRWIWKALSYVGANLPALISTGMHWLGQWSRLQTEIGIAISLTANLILTILLIGLHVHHRRRGKRHAK